MTFQLGISQVFDPLRLRLLVEAGRRGSVAAAAQTCGVGQPSASKHLKTLEAAVGEPLLRRARGGSDLTETGRVVATHAAQVLDVLAALEDELQALRGGECGALTIAASTTPGTYVIPSVLKCFASRHPGVEITLSIGPSAQVIDQVARREAQLGIAGELAAAPGLSFEPFLDDELIGICAPGTFAPPAPVALDEFARHTLLVREPGSSSRLTAERHLLRAGFAPRNHWELDSNEAIKRGVAAGLGIAFLSRLVVEDEIQRGDLHSFRPADVEPLTRRIQLIRAHARQPSPSERAFIATLADCCAGTVPECVVDLTAVGVAAVGQP